MNSYFQIGYDKNKTSISLELINDVLRYFPLYIKRPTFLATEIVNVINI